MAPSSFKLNTGQEIPIIGFGTWQAPPGEVAKAVEIALKSGYKLIDAAYCYANEDEVGQGLKAAFASGIKREDIFVMTKLWNTYSTRAEVGLEKSLKALGLDYVDLYLVHWPCGMRGVGGWSPKGPEAADRFPMLKEDPSQRDMLWDHDHIQTWKAMEGLLKSGKTKAIGVCNYSKVYLQQLLKHCEVKPAVNQLENHPLLHQQETVDFCKEQGIHVIAFSPFGSTGAPLMKFEPVLEVAKRKQVGPGCVLLSYAVARGNTVLAMATKEEWVRDNLNIVDLDADDMQLLNSIAKDQGPKRFVYPPFGINFGFPDKPEGRSMPNGA